MKSQYTVVVLAPGSVIHTIKWCNEMAKRGFFIHLITMHPPKERLDSRIQIHSLKFKKSPGYFLNTWQLKKLLKEINPDLLHIHYASGYGTLGRLSQFHPTLLSVWGSDVFSFPYQAKWKDKLLRKNLSFADSLASTSAVMREQTSRFIARDIPIAITPFGVDMDLFKPHFTSKNDSLVLGTVKRFEPVYGVMKLLSAFHQALEQGLPEDSQLILIGGGSQHQEILDYIKRHNLSSRTTVLGNILQHEVPNWLNKFDIYLALSLEESFGVAILEASACELPVIVSDRGGLPEVVKDQETGFVVDINELELVVEKILELGTQPELRKKMGQAGRLFVNDNYEWNHCGDKMEALYLKLLA